METNLLDGSLNPVNVARVIKYTSDFYKSHPGYFRPEGLLVFVANKVLENAVCCTVRGKAFV
ncbi:MAG: hypothetical protein ACLR0U_04935 [Enterocloster clostridioformis]